MTVKLNNRAFDHAQSLIRDGKYVIDDRDAWSEHQEGYRKPFSVSLLTGVSVPQ